MMKQILIMSLVVFFVGCGGSSDEKSRVQDNSKLWFTSPSEIEVKDGEQYVTTLEVDGCVGEDKNIMFDHDGGDAESFSVGSRSGIVKFIEAPDHNIKDTYQFTVYATAISCLNESAELNLTVKAENDGTATPASVPSSETINQTSITVNESDYFITRWKTDNNGTSNDNQIVIPTKKYKDYNYTIYWGDGTNNQEVTETITHTYDAIGTYTIKIYGTFPQFVSYEHDYSADIYIGDHGKLVYIEQWGTIKWKSMEDAFLGCSNMVGNFTDTPDLSDVSDMSGMFYGAKRFNADISSWDVSNVVYMNDIFAGAENFNRDIGQWDVSNVISMQRMFYSAKIFNQDISSWDVSKVTSMRSMFIGAKKFNRGIGSWDVSKVTDMSSMFSFAINFNQNINRWDVSNVTDMHGMFFGVAGGFTSSSSGSIKLPKITSEYSMRFNQNIGSWNVSNVTNMGWMFTGAENFNQDISGWDVLNVTDMSLMFDNTKSFNKDIGNWDVSKVTSMWSMFAGAENFNQDIGKWDVSNVIGKYSMYRMFSGAKKFNQDISDWDVSNVSDMTSMFSYTTSFSNHDLSSWNVSSVTEHESFSDGWGTGNTEPNWQQ